MNKNRTLYPRDWDLQVSQNGELVVQGWSTVELARSYGTPLHVVNEPRLFRTAKNFQETVCTVYPEKSSVHFAFKCNSVPAIVEIIREAGLKAEVMTPYELSLALQVGFSGDEIIVNGPCKTREFLRACCEARVRFIVIDSLDELYDVEKIARSLETSVDVLLRVNPDYVPKGMNAGSATGSRRSPFGLDVRSNEVDTALSIIKRLCYVRFQGFHFHIGTGIRNPKDYSSALRCLSDLIFLAKRYNLDINVLDVGGGMASMTTRELTTVELLLSEGFGKFPKFIQADDSPVLEDFIREITNAITKSFSGQPLPELILEPGRSIVSSNQFLLLTVYRVKHRDGVGTWYITDGGLGTVTLPTYYEYHEVFLCNDVHRPRTKNVTIVGPACFAGDIVYRNKLMPTVLEGEIIAIMDSGAYFTALESSFGFPRPAIVGVSSEGHRLIRHRETFEDMIHRDCFNNMKKETV